MNSTDLEHTGAGTVTPPAVGLCWTDQGVLMAPTAAPIRGTGLPIAGTATPVRLRGPIAAAGTTTGAFVRPFVEPTVLESLALVGVPSAYVSNTPGDLPPEDPLS